VAGRGGEGMGSGRGRKRKKRRKRKGGVEGRGGKWSGNLLHHLWGTDAPAKYFDYGIVIYTMFPRCNVAVRHL